MKNYSKKIMSLTQYTSIWIKRKSFLLSIITVGMLASYSAESDANPLFSLEKIGCPTLPSKDITIDDASVTLNEDNNAWIIARDGTVTLNGKFVPLTDDAQKSAEKYQTALRNQLPELYQETEQLIDANLGKLDSVISKMLGERSQLRGKLKEMTPILQEELGYIINQDVKGNLSLYLSHLQEMNTRIDALVEKHSQPILQSLLSDIATRQLFGKKSEKINLDGLKKELETQFQEENIKAKDLLNKACTTFEKWESLETQFLKQAEPMIKNGLI